MSQPNFYAIIPASVRYDETVCANAKLLYGEITAMCSAEGYCWAENGYFAELYKVGSETISRWISQLEKKGYIKSELNKKEGNTRKIFISESSANLLRKNARPIAEKRKTYCAKTQDPIAQKRKSIYENITINNTVNRESSALNFFEVNYPSEFERLMMQYKSQIINWDDFVKSFESTVDQEGLEFKLNVLRGRFGKYAQNWIRNQNKFNGKVVEMVPNGPIKKINSL